jgi:uncharacterized membrane protein
MPPTIFEASIVPHRSLNAKGVATLLGVLTALVALIVGRCWLIGAWPVAVFSILDVPLLAMLLWLNMRGRRVNEMILMTAQDVTVTHTDRSGQRATFRMPTAWLRVDQETTQGASRLMLRARGSEREIGGFLHEVDRESLYRALRDAVHAVRNPSFDNPQLRGD